MKMISVKNKSTRLLINCFLLLPFTAVFFQENTTTQDTVIVKVDSLYREDQFYFAITYNTLMNNPSGVSQSKFSSGLSAGF